MVIGEDERWLNLLFKKCCLLQPLEPFPTLRNDFKEKKIDHFLSPGFLEKAGLDIKILNKTDTAKFSF